MKQEFDEAFAAWAAFGGGLKTTPRSTGTAVDRVFTAPNGMRHGIP